MRVAHLNIELLRVRDLDALDRLRPHLVGAVVLEWSRKHGYAGVAVHGFAGVLAANRVLPSHAEPLGLQQQVAHGG